MLDSPYVSGTNEWAERTSLGELDLSPEDIEYIKLNLPNIGNNTFDDFKKFNGRSYTLQDYLPTNDEYVFISEADVQLFFRDWEAFSTKYPDVIAYTSLSRIGFNESYTQAIIISNRYIKLFDAPFEYGGYGILHLYRKLGRKWVEQEILVVFEMG